MWIGPTRQVVASDAKPAPGEGPRAHSRAERDRTLGLEAAGVIELPLYFPSSGRTLFGWLCQPTASAAASLGVVICNPFGYESISAHRSVRAFAAEAAAVGLPALRFDYADTGDSEDMDPQVDHIRPWAKDIVAAVRELRRRTAVERVCLLGFRLGALLAALAAPECDAVTALALVAPVLSGRRYVRELRAFRIGTSAKPAGRPAGPGQEDGLEISSDGSLEVAGYPLSSASVASLSEMNLALLQTRPARDVLVIDRSDLPTAHDWANALAALGARTQYWSLPGYVEMMTRPPYYAALPQTMLVVMRDWLAALRGPGRRRDAHSGLSVVNLESDLRSATLTVPGAARGAQSAVTERAVFFGSEAPLFGITTEPPTGDACKTAVILVNDGASHHVGSNRLHVSLARKWAQRGCLVLRMDLAGLGDSETRPGRPPDEVFPPAAVADIRAAIEFLQTRYGIDEVVLAGVCSGAYHSLRTAVAVAAVSRILLVNPRNYYWTEGTPLESLDPIEVALSPRDYRRLFYAADWRRLFNGQIEAGKILSGYLDCAALFLKAGLRAAARRLRIRLARDLGRELEELAERGVRIAFVFAKGEVGISGLRAQAGSSVERIADRCRVHIIDGGDHVFSRVRPRKQLEEILTAELFVDQ